MQVVNHPISLKFYRDVNNKKKEINRIIGFSHRPILNFFKHKVHRWDSQTIWKTRILQTNIERISWNVWKLRLRTCSSSEPTLKYNKKQTNYFTKYRRWHLRKIKLKRNSRFTFLKNTLSNFPKIAIAKFLERDRISCFISINGFVSFKNPFAKISSSSEPTLDID